MSLLEMSGSLKGRDFLSLKDYTSEEIIFLLDFATKSEPSSIKKKPIIKPLPFNPKIDSCFCCKANKPDDR